MWYLGGMIHFGLMVWLAVVGVKDDVNPHVVPFPQQCDELLPVDELFTEFLRESARVLAVTHKKSSRLALRVLAYRDELQDEVNWDQNAINPADTFLRAYLCRAIKPDKRLSVLSSSVEIATFIDQYADEIAGRIRLEIVKRRVQKLESRKLKKQLESTQKEFSALRLEIRQEVRSQLERAVSEASRTSNSTK
jgi:hypothetical protein